MQTFIHKMFFVGLTLTLFSLLVAVPPGFSLATAQTNNKTANNTIPYDHLYFLYNLKAKKDSSPLFNINLIINYTRITTNSNSGYNYQQRMVLQSFLFAFIGERQENATFFENSSNRLIQLNNTEGSYIEWLIYHVSSYNDSANAFNWDPFWIIPQDVNQTYPIYSFQFNLTQRTVLTPSDIALFNTTRPVLIFNGEQQINSSNENITNTFGLIYDNDTGILIKGVLNSNIVGLNATNNYYANFELAKTNAPIKFTVSNTTTPNPIDIFIPKQLKQPNYLLLVIIIALPILLTMVRFLRLKEISGGME